VSFLSPWLWLGALAVGVPLWLHLRARAGPVFPFPTLRFLEDQPRPRAAGVRLRDALLLLARAAAVLLIAAAFAWPYLRRAEERVVESRVHVLDNTLSHRAAGGFERDRERVRAALLQGGPRQQDAVIELQGRPRVVVGFGDARPEGAERVAALQPSFARGSYLEALRLAQTMLAQSLGTQRRIFIYGDRQENQWTEGQTSPPFLEGVTVELVSGPGAASRPNLSLGNPSVRRLFVGEEAWVDLAVELAHDGPYRSARVRLLANGETVLVKDLALSGERGAATLRGQWASRPGEWLRGEIVIEGAGDALPADDRVFFALPPVHEGRVGLLARSPYLRAALAPDTMRGRWSARPLDPGADLSSLPERELPEVLVVEGDYAQSQQVRALVLRCLNNGRGVLLFLARLTPLLEGFLRELGLESAPGPAHTAPAGFRFAAADHPILKPFLRGELGDLQEVKILQRVRLRAPHAAPLLFGADGNPLLIEGTSTRGRLLVFTFAMDRRQTDWPLHPSFIPFLDLAMQHARAETEVQTSAAPGELVVHHVPAGETARQVVLRDGGTTLARAAVDGAGRAQVEAPPRPGIYALAHDDGGEARALLAVNPPAKESVLRYVETPAALAAWTLAGPPRRESTPAPVAPALLRALDQRLWWWCLAAGAAALLVETALLFRRRAAS
jgi:hypothetical protein